MSDIFFNIVGIGLMTCLAFGLIAVLIKACADDAVRRGKSPLWVVLAVVLFFPWGLIAWLLFRPEPVDRGGSGRPFRLEDHQLQ